MIFYAVVYVLVVNGVDYLIAEPVASLTACRKIAAQLRADNHEEIVDARCTMIIPDSEDL